MGTKTIERADATPENSALVVTKSTDITRNLKKRTSFGVTTAINKDIHRPHFGSYMGSHKIISNLATEEDFSLTGQAKPIRPQFVDGNNRQRLEGFNQQDFQKLRQLLNQLDSTSTNPEPTITGSCSMASSGI